MSHSRVIRLFLCLLVPAPLLIGTPPVLAQDQAQQTRDGLINAASNGKLDQVKAILEAHPDFISGTDWQTPLGVAVSNAQIEIMQYLLDKGADPNATYQNSTPLEQAIQRWDDKWKPMAEALVAKGALVNGMDDDGQMPFTFLFARGNSDRQKERVDWLLSKGANINQPNRQGQTPLMLAINSGNTDVLNAILDKADPKLRDDMGNTPLFVAARAGKIEAVRALLSRGADVNAQNASGDTVLHVAALGSGNGNFNAILIKILLDAGANANLPNLRGDLPLHVAMHQDVSLSRMYNNATGDYPALPDQNAAPRGLQLAPLIDKTDINKRDSSGFSPLALSISTRDVETRDLIHERVPKTDSTLSLFDSIASGEATKITTLLTQKPYLIYFRLPDGSTPLHISALWGTLGTAQVLIKRGADVNARDAQGQTPLIYALRNPTARFARRSRNMATFLIAQKADVNVATPAGDTALHFAARAGDAELINLLLSKGAKVNARGTNGETPLLILTNRSADINLYKTLIAKGADVNARSGSTTVPNNYYQGDILNAQTPLLRAVAARRLDMIEVLLDKGAKIDAAGADGRTALSTAISNSYGSSDSGGLNDIAIYLIQKGANPAIRTNQQDLLSFAIDRGNADVVKALLATKKVSLKSSRNRQSPLYSAVANNRLELVKILMDAGADPSEVDQYGRNPLQGANSDEMKKLLNDRIAQIAAEKAAAAPKADTPTPAAPPQPAPAAAPAVAPQPPAPIARGGGAIGPPF